MTALIRKQLERADELHARSMELADQALTLGFQGQQPESRRRLEEAFKLERDAADLLRDADIPELSRAVYHRSAASLAIQVRDWDEATRLIEQGLSGSAPHSIAAELKELRQVVAAQRPDASLVEHSVPMLPSYEVERVTIYARAFVADTSDSYLQPRPA